MCRMVRFVKLDIIFAVGCLTLSTYRLKFSPAGVSDVPSNRWTEARRTAAIDAYFAGLLLVYHRLSLRILLIANIYHICCNVLRLFTLHQVPQNRATIRTSSI
jgi:hypothetical protein